MKAWTIFTFVTLIRCPSYVRPSVGNANKQDFAKIKCEFSC